MTDKLHSKLGASSSHRWWHCPGSIKLSEGIPNTSSHYAREGSCAHAVAETCLNNGQDAVSLIGRVISEYSDIEISEEMAEAVQVYLDCIRSDMAQYADAELSVETQFDLSHIYAGMFGTNDACLYIPSKAKLIVYDYKHGQGVAVDVKENPQMLYYGVGALTGKHNRPITEVELVIVQPRCFNTEGKIRRWSTDPIYMTDWIADLQQAADRTVQDKPEFITGDWCRFCPAASICPTLEKKSLEIAQAEFSTEGELIVPEVQGFSSERLGEILDHADIIENWIRSVRAFAHVEAEAGRIPVGYKLVNKRATRKHKDEQATLDFLFDYGICRADITTPGKLMSPKQIEDFIKTKGIKKEELADLWVTPVGGTTLSPIGDKREAVRPEAAREFTE